MLEMIKSVNVHEQDGSFAKCRLLVFYPYFDQDCHYRGAAIVENTGEIKPYGYSVMVDDSGKYLHVNELSLKSSDRSMLMRYSRYQLGQGPLILDEAVHQAAINGQISWLQTEQQVG